MARPGPELLARLFDEHSRSLVLFARQRCSCPEDIVQEAFIKLARQSSLPDRPVAWLFRVVRNGAISWARGQRRGKQREAKASVSEAWFETTDDRIDAQRASELLGELDPETRELIVARLWGGLTFDEIAQISGCSLTTLHRRYHAGLALLQERLEPSWTQTITRTT